MQYSRCALTSSIQTYLPFILCNESMYSIYLSSYLLYVNANLYFMSEGNQKPKYCCIPMKQDSVFLFFPQKLISSCFSIFAICQLSLPLWLIHFCGVFHTTCFPTYLCSVSANTINPFTRHYYNLYIVKVPAQIFVAPQWLLFANLKMINFFSTEFTAEILAIKSDQRLVKI